MSDLSVFNTDVVNFFKNLFAKGSPATQTAVQPVLQNLQNAETAAAAALPTIANEAVNAVMGLLGPVGVDAEPLADAFIDQVIAKLTAKKSTPPEAAAT